MCALVTGVQTCALPIFLRVGALFEQGGHGHVPAVSAHLHRRTRADEFLADHLRADDVDRLPGPAIALGDHPIEIALIDRERAEGADELPKVGPEHMRWRRPVERQKGAHLRPEGIGGYRSEEHTPEPQSLMPHM